MSSYGISQPEQEISVPDAVNAPSRLLRLPDVLDRIGLRRSRLYDLVARGRFPQPVQLSSRAVAWHESEVDAWCAGRPRAQIGKPSGGERMAS